MSFLLRKIRKARWYKKELSGSSNPMPGSELQADALIDLKTDTNRLSVWLIDGDKSNLDRVAAALACSADNLSNFDYVLIAEQRVSQLGIQMEPNFGDTLDQHANHTWHRDLCDLTVADMHKLAIAIGSHGDHARYTVARVKGLISTAISNSYIQKADLKEGIRKKIT